MDVRSLVPIDTQTILGSVATTHRVFTVEENPRLCGWGAELVSIIADEAFYIWMGRRSASRRRIFRCPRWTAGRSGDADDERIAETIRRAMGA